AWPRRGCRFPGRHRRQSAGPRGPGGRATPPGRCGRADAGGPTSYRIAPCSTKDHKGDEPMLTAHNFTYGLLTPALGFLMSCLGAFLGLRCTVRAMALDGRTRLRWLLLAALSIGTTGIWVMHFI